MSLATETWHIQDKSRCVSAEDGIQGLLLVVSQNHISTDSQSVRLGFKPPFQTHIFVFCFLFFVFFLSWGVLPDGGTSLSFNNFCRILTMVY